MSETGNPKPQASKPTAVVLQAKFEQAFALHQRGKLADAERIYQEVLRQQPNHFDALHMLGVIALETQHGEQGADLIMKAIRLNASVAAAHSNLGKALLDLKRPADALASFDKAIALKPGLAMAHNNRGKAFNDLKLPEEALASYDKAIALKPDYTEAYSNRGVALQNLKRPEDALASYNKAIALEPGFASAHYNRGNALQDLKRPADALASYERAIALKPDYAEAYCNRGHALKDLKRREEALASYDKAIALKPDYGEAYSNRGNVLSSLKRSAEALASYDKAIALKPGFASAYYNRGLALQDLKRPADAVASYDKAISLRPDLAMAHYNRGIALEDLNRHEQALASHDKAIALTPDFAEAHNNRGNVLLRLKTPADALASYDKAIALQPDFAEAHNNRGLALQDLKRPADALASYDRAIALKPDYTDAWFNRGNIFRDLNRQREAIGAYAQVLKIDPKYPLAKGALLLQKIYCCDWKGLDDLISEIDGNVASGTLSVEPFVWQAVSHSQRSLQKCAELYNEKISPAYIKIFTRPPFANPRKIRIGYSSGEFREQATSHLIVGVLELHNNSQFEIYAVDNGLDDKSEIRKRINASVRGIIDISKLSDSSAVAAICENQIDILVNLNGYFGKHRTQVFAQRPAPIQANYLGFPGTLGASYIDYIIADQHVVPPSHKEFYTEKVVYLPDCYQANDRKKEIGTRLFSRAECGLPQNGFIFCCFNNNYKITPEVFSCWMRLLIQVDGSVLWLLEDSASASANLRKEAVARGINAERIIFAKRMLLPDHLARHRLADLFLDTLPCNAHTTASDALWAGLPVLTCFGATFSGRVAGSLLNAIGLPELITTTLEAYEEMAIDFATHPEKLAIIKRKLAENRLTTPLFDTKRFTRHIEAAYIAMYDRYQAGLPPEHIIVPT